MQHWISAILAPSGEMDHGIPCGIFWGNGAMGRKGYNPNMGECTVESTSPRHSLIGSLLGFYVSSHWAFSVKHYFLAHGFESLIPHFNKGQSSLVPYAARYHGIPWLTASLSAKIAKTQCRIERKCWVCWQKTFPIDDYLLISIIMYVHVHSHVSFNMLGFILFFRE